MTTRQAAIAAIAIGSLALPASASAKAKTKSVSLGPPPAASKAIGKAVGDVPVDVNAFFPGKITIHPGDKVKFLPSGFHNVDFAPKGGSAPGLIAPTGQSANETDAAGNPFWFNGQPLFSINPALVASGHFDGKTTTFSPAKGYDTGLPVADKPKPAIVRFPKKGTYRYVCVVHPGMKGVVRVKRGHVPSRKADRKRLRKQTKRAVKTAKKLVAATPPAGQVTLGATGKGGVELFAFLPGNVTVPAGSTVRFAMPTGTPEIHTASGGPGNPEDASSYLGGLANSFLSPSIAGAALYPSDPPGTGVLTASSHGNGFASTGVLDDDDASPNPPANTITFPQPGTFTLYCLVHPFMSGTVTVQ